MTGREQIAEAFRKARQQGRAALIPYVTAGVPDLRALPEILRALGEAGADLVEVGIPFSDPLADGPVLQRAATWALAQGVRLADIWQTLNGVVDGPVRVALTYVNTVLRRGPETFMGEAARAHLAGAIIPDLPWIEGLEVRRAAQAAGLAVIPLVAPTSTDQHLEAIAQGEGFVYAVSVTGVTGMREEVAAGVEELVRRVRERVDLPVAIGFGISTPEQARQVGKVADGVIVGSALMARIMEAPAEAAEQAFRFTRSLRQALEA
ncbi:MAG: tryptophan synthase subunit alpha [Firmicutes bacterium]|nr:tryptophan synthase subunit alpha [Bacillota bacterium]